MKPIPIERKEIKPQKVQICSVHELPYFATIKLKKAPTPVKKEIESTVVPNVLLKSRILRFEWPPTIHYLTVTILPEVYEDNGVLSRNYVEAMTVKKTKRRKFKPTDYEKILLEKFEPFPQHAKLEAPDVTVHA